MAPREVVRRRIKLHGRRATSWQGDEPTILFAPHFYGLDAGGTALTHAARRGAFIAIYTTQRNPMVDDWFCEGRAALRRRAAVQPQRRRQADRRGLRKGGLLYLLPDMNFGRDESIFVPFYGVPAATVPSLSRFARLGRAKVVPVVTQLTPEGYEIEVLPAWTTFRPTTSRPTPR